VQIRVNRDGLIASFLPSAVFGVQAARDLGRYLRVRDRQPQHHTKGDGGPTATLLAKYLSGLAFP
jgi:hypothetical protein